MSLIVTLIPNPPALIVAKQVARVNPAGAIQFLDGSQELFLVTPAGQTFVPTAGGNVVPNPGDWILNNRLTLNTQAPSNGGAVYAGGIPVAPNPNGPFTVVTNTQFQAQYYVSYGEGYPVPNQIVP